MVEFSGWRLEYWLLALISVLFYEDRNEINDDKVFDSFMNGRNKRRLLSGHVLLYGISDGIPSSEYQRYSGHRPKNHLCHAFCDGFYRRMHLASKPRGRFVSGGEYLPSARLFQNDGDLLLREDPQEEMKVKNREKE